MPNICIFQCDIAVLFIFVSLKTKGIKTFIVSNIVPFIPHLEHFGTNLRSL